MTGIPEYADLDDSRRLGMELAAERKKANDERFKSIEDRQNKVEKSAERLFWMILGGSFAVMVTVVSSAAYVGSRFERIESVAAQAQVHESRIQRLEEKAMRGSP